MSVDDIRSILVDFGIDPAAEISVISTGHINSTFRIVARDRSFILQRINTNVFREPEIIASNLEHARHHLGREHPGYLFLYPLPTRSGEAMAYDANGLPWRIFPYIENTYTIDEAQNVEQAREAAAAFGRFGRLMKGADLALFQPTISRFHDLGLRYQQFEDALRHATDTAKKSAAGEVHLALRFRHLVARYQSMIASRTLKPGIFHNDTKINNVLFDRTTNKAVAVIDLDTVMEGYFIYDLGDLVRTLVSPVSEEEKNLALVEVRNDVYQAVVQGYLEEFGQTISPSEQQLVPFAGLMMTYIMALRFLADYLRGNTYYHITYPDQNLVRARNQLRLLELLEKSVG